MGAAIKICGLTNPADARLAHKCGADFGGAIIEVERSPRSLRADEAPGVFEGLPLRMVAVTLGMTPAGAVRLAAEINPFALQLHGRETPAEAAAVGRGTTCEVWKALHFPAAGDGEPDVEALLALAAEYADAGVNRFVLDATVKSGDETQYGGTGKRIDWEAAAVFIQQCPLPVMLAGGLTADNATKALETAKPAGLDVSSGVESSPGIKDPGKVLRLINAARAFKTRESGMA